MANGKWVKGQSGNPKGGRGHAGCPDTLSWARILRKEGSKKDTTARVTYRNQVCQMLYKLARSGNIQAAKMIMDKEEPEKGLLEFSGSGSFKIQWISDGSASNDNGPL